MDLEPRRWTFEPHAPKAFREPIAEVDGRMIITFGVVAGAQPSKAELDGLTQLMAASPKLYELVHEALVNEPGWVERATEVLAKLPTRGV